MRCMLHSAVQNLCVRVCVCACVRVCVCVCVCVKVVELNSDVQVRLSQLGLKRLALKLGLRK